MKVVIRAMKVNKHTNEFLYDLAYKEVPEGKSVRDTIVELLLEDWFGEAGDCLLVTTEDDENV